MQREYIVSYETLWQTMRERRITTYDLTVKHHFNKGTLYRLQHGHNVNISTIAELCKILECNVEDVVKIE